MDFAGAGQTCQDDHLAAHVLDRPPSAFVVSHVLDDRSGRDDHRCGEQLYGGRRTRNLSTPGYFSPSDVLVNPVFS